MVVTHYMISPNPTMGEIPPGNPVGGFPPKDRVGGSAYHIGVTKAITDLVKNITVRSK